MTSSTSSSASSKSGSPRPHSGSPSTLASTFAAAVALTLLAYWPVAGAGFQTDDFRWLWHARLDGWADLGRIFSETLGFYRPFTQLLWALDLWRAGPDPLPFFVTNLTLHVLVLGLFAIVARRLAGDTAVAAAAVALAALSHHYNNMAVVWISGRGALLGAVASLAALWLWDRWCREDGGALDWLAACGMTALALGSYEAVAGLPLLMAFMIPYRSRAARPLAGALGPLALWAPYLVMRVVVGARQPWNEGEGYSYELGAVFPNLLEYAGRALAVAAVLLVILAAVALTARCLAPVARAAWRGARPIAGLSTVWFVVGLLPALPVAARSNLYVYFAALGLHLIAGAALVSAYRELQQRHRKGALSGAATISLLIVLAWPAFAWDRNQRIGEQARLSMAAIDDIRRSLPSPRAGDCVVLIDDRDRTPNLHTAFSADLHWLGAFVFDEEPSDRVRFAEDERTDSCARHHIMRLAPRNTETVLLVEPSTP